MSDQKALCQASRITIAVTSGRCTRLRRVDIIRTCYGDANGTWRAMGRGLKQCPVGSGPFSFRLSHGRFTISLPPPLPHSDNFIFFDLTVLYFDR